MKPASGQLQLDLTPESPQQEVASAVDGATIACLRAALGEARRTGDHRPAFAVVAACLGELGLTVPARVSAPVSLPQARDEWLRRLRSQGRSESTLAAYRIALDDLLRWLDGRADDGDGFREQTIVAYLEGYRRRARPADATYYRRFVLLRRFFRWLAPHAGVPDPFLELEAPQKPRQVADWLTTAEFARLLEAAATPVRRFRGLAERDRLVLLTLVVTGLRRSELIALDWRDLDLNEASPSLLVRSGKGGRPRRQPLAPALARKFAEVRAHTEPSAEAAVFRGLRGGRLQPTILAGIVRRASERAGIEKRVTAHTLRHTAATWLRSATGDARLVAEYLGHADLSTVHRYAHVTGEELDAAAAAIAAQVGLEDAGVAP